MRMLGLVRELRRYAAARKRWWLVPVILALVAAAAFLSFLEAGSVVAGPFIYTLF